MLGEFSCYTAIQKFSLDGKNNVFIFICRAVFLEKDVFTFLSLLVKNTEYLYL